ncbi:MAG: hypothetical protein AAF761_02150 [Pseudomonadota bacterium]
MAAPAAAAQYTCTHVTKSTLMQAPLARPVFLPQETADIDIDANGRIAVRLHGQTLRATLRACEAGGTWNRACPYARSIAGDVISVFRQPKEGAALHAVWHRKGNRAQDIVENVVLRCLTRDAAQ